VLLRGFDCKVFDSDLNLIAIGSAEEIKEYNLVLVHVGVYDSFRVENLDKVTVQSLYENTVISGFLYDINYVKRTMVIGVEKASAVVRRKQVRVLINEDKDMLVGGKLVTCKVLNISTGGMAISCGTQKFSVSDSVFFVLNKMSILGVIKWVRRYNGCITYGVEFAELQKQVKDEIFYFILNKLTAREDVLSV